MHSSDTTEFKWKVLVLDDRPADGDAVAAIEGLKKAGLDVLVVKRPRELGQTAMIGFMRSCHIALIDMIWDSVALVDRSTPHEPAFLPTGPCELRNTNQQLVEYVTSWVNAVLYWSVRARPDQEGAPSQATRGRTMPIETAIAAFAERLNTEKNRAARSTPVSRRCLSATSATIARSI